MTFEEGCVVLIFILGVIQTVKIAYPRQKEMKALLILYPSGIEITDVTEVDRKAFWGMDFNKVTKANIVYGEYPGVNDQNVHFQKELIYPFPHSYKLGRKEIDGNKVMLTFARDFRAFAKGLALGISFSLLAAFFSWFMIWHPLPFSL